VPLAGLATLALGGQIADAAEDQPRLAPDFLTNAHNIFDDPAGPSRFADAAVSHLEADIQYLPGPDRLVSAHRPEEIGADSPSIAQVFAYLRAHPKCVLLDLKPTVCTAQGVDRLLAAIGDSGLPPARVALSTPKWEVLDAVKAREPTLLTLYSIVDGPSLLAFLLRLRVRRLANSGVSLQKDLASLTVVRTLHAAGLRVQVWTVNREDEARDLIRRGVDGITSDDPRLLVRVRPPRGGRLFRHV
jgi:glycerophosphoryl diester phosphodiesterase